MIDAKGGLTVLQALSLAQGFNKTAAQRKAFIIRKNDAKILHLGSDIQNILDGKRTDAGLSNGDVLYVPSSLGKTFGYRGIEAAIQLGTASRSTSTSSLMKRSYKFCNITFENGAASVKKALSKQIIEHRVALSSASSWLLEEFDFLVFDV